MRRKSEFVLHKAIPVVGIHGQKGADCDGHPQFDVLNQGKQHRIDVCSGDIQGQNRDGQERTKEQTLGEGFRRDHSRKCEACEGETAEHANEPIVPVAAKDDAGWTVGGDHRDGNQGNQ